MKTQETENTLTTWSRASEQEPYLLSEEEQGLISDLYQRNFNTLICYATKECKSRTIAEDIVQDTFYFAMKDSRIEKIRKFENPDGYLMRVLQYKIQAHRKRRGNWAMSDIADYEEELMAVEEQYGMKELDMVIHQLLTPHERMLLHMYYVEGRSTKELAQAEGITEDNFKVRMYRLRKKLAKELDAD